MNWYEYWILYVCGAGVAFAVLALTGVRRRIVGCVGVGIVCGGIALAVETALGSLQLQGLAFFSGLGGIFGYGIMRLLMAG